MATNYNKKTGEHAPLNPKKQEELDASIHLDTPKNEANQHFLDMLKENIGEDNANYLLLTMILVHSKDAKAERKLRIDELKTELKKNFKEKEIEKLNNEELVELAEIYIETKPKNAEIKLMLSLIYMDGVNGIASNIEKSQRLFIEYFHPEKTLTLSEKIKLRESISVVNLTRLAIERPIQAISAYNTIQTLHETISIFSIMACVVFPVLVVADLINIAKHVIADKEPRLSKTQQLKNALFKDDRHLRLMNNAMWSGIAIFSYIVKNTPQLAALCPPLLLGGYFVELVQTHYEYKKEIALYKKLLNSTDDPAIQKHIKGKITEVKEKYADKHFFATMGFLGTATMVFPPLALVTLPLLVYTLIEFDNVLTTKQKVAIAALAITAIAVAVSPIGPAALVIGAAMLFVSQFISLVRKVKAVYDKKTATATTEEKPDLDAGLAKKPMKP